MRRQHECFLIVSPRAGHGMGMWAIPSCYEQSTASPLRAHPPVLKVLPGGLQAEPPEPERVEVGDLAPESGVFRATPVRLGASSEDAVLATAACAGSHVAAAIIVKRYTPRVRGKLHRWIGPTDIDDRVQEVFIRLFEQLPRLRDPNALRGFLIGITLRIACTELRRRRRSRTCLTATGEVPEPRVKSDDSELAREALWRFESILEQLSPSSRRVFVLRYVEMLELTDVATEMGISVATAKRHLARAAATVGAMVKREPALLEYLPPASQMGEARMFSASN
jgi:RNA polymerase sigma-70 factor (ECF subfamily)